MPGPWSGPINTALPEQETGEGSSSGQTDAPAGVGEPTTGLPDDHEATGA